MRSDDAGSEEPGAATPARSRGGGRVLVPLVALGAAVVVLSAALEGPVRITPLELGGSDGVVQAPAPEVSQAPVRPPAAQTPPALDAVVQTILLVLVLLAAALVAVALIRLIVSAIRNRQRRSGLRRLQGVDAEQDEPVADAPAVLRGIAAALVSFEEDRAPGDAVVRAWLGLQQAAEDAGFARSPAETPTEFTGRVLSRTGADRAALRTLLRLYLRARFGDGAISDRDADDARDALRTLESSWERLAAADRG